MFQIIKAVCTRCMKFRDLIGMVFANDDNLYCGSCKPKGLTHILITKKLFNMTKEAHVQDRHKSYRGNR